MAGMTSAESACVERAVAQQESMLARTMAWAAVNSGSRNLDGLGAVAGTLADAMSALPGELTLVDPAPVEAVDSAGKRV